MKYKVGDVVRIRSKEWFDAQEKNEEGGLPRNEPIFVSDMFDYAGKIAKLTTLSDEGKFNLDIDDDGYWWPDWMFDPDYDPSKEPLPAEDAIRAMLDGEVLYRQGGFEYHFDPDAYCFMQMRNDVAGAKPITFFDGLYRRPVAPVKTKRLMTRWEILSWANSDASRGWVCCYHVSATSSAALSLWWPPQYSRYGEDLTLYYRARLLPDLSGIDESTIQRFEVEE
jgi:hypothetical protein